MGIDLQHALFGVTLEGKLHLAPISDKIENCLDIATGIYSQPLPQTSSPF